MSRFLFFLGIISALVSAWAFAGYGGPDADDYVWIDSEEEGGPDYYYINITSTGTPFFFGDNTFGFVNFSVPFTYRSSSYTTLYAGSNGMIAFSSGGMEVYTNTSIPQSSSPNNLIALFWDDLKPNIGGDGYYKVDGSSIIVSYDGIPRYDGSLALNFQAQLDADADIIEVHYKSTEVGDAQYDYGASATAGMENFNGTIGLQVSYNSPQLGEYYAIAYFKHNGEPPGGFNLLLPEDGSSQPAPSDVIHFEWQASAVTQPYGVHHYLLEIADSEDFSNIVYSETLYETQTEVTYSWTRGQYYYWRVTAYDTWEAEETECNQPFSFYVPYINVAPTSVGHIKANYPPSGE